MTSGWKVACFGAAFVCFVVAAVLDVVRGGRWSGFLSLVKVGLAFFTLVFLWDALAADP